MSDFKLLFDTNVIIALEDAQPVTPSLAELVRLCGEYQVSLFVDGANYDDIDRDSNIIRRAVTKSKLDKFQQLRQVAASSDVELSVRFGLIKNENDRSDARLLAALKAKAVDFLITEDGGLHRRADRAGLTHNVLTVEEALDWLRQTFQEKSVNLPYVVEQKAYQLNTDDPIFISLREDYPKFDQWFDKCRTEHRDCWILEIGKQTAGIVIRKDETHLEARTQHPGPKILKICTFKVRQEFLGEKFGELLLKQILWFSQRNRYDLIYLTAFPKHAFLVNLLAYYGFSKTRYLPNGEIVLEKVLLHGPVPASTVDALEFDRLNYPRFVERSPIKKFCVPIRPDYHQRLFPELATGKELPLFPEQIFGPMLDGDRTPGNTIRKVYLCRAKTNLLRPGDILVFYVSKGEAFSASQSITTIGIVEQVTEAGSIDDLIRLTAKRSVFSVTDLQKMDPSPHNPVKAIDFLLVGHIEPFIPLKRLLSTGVFARRPPQSIAMLNEERYSALRPYLKMGFEL